MPEKASQYPTRILPLIIVCTLGILVPPLQAQPTTDDLVPRFEMPESGLVLERPTRAGAFFDVVGRRTAVFGYENRPFEVWTYPLKLVDDFRLSFQIEDYPVPIDGLETMTYIEVRPEATTLTYTHAAFTVRQILFAPVDEPGLIMLLDVDTVRPLRITASFRPDLKLMWPAGLMTGFLGWIEDEHVYFIGEETRRFAGIVGSPLARDVSVQPYQEEPKDLPNRFVMDVTPEMTTTHLIPIVITGSVNGQEEAKATYDRLLASAPDLYRQNVAYYERLLDQSMRIDTPDDRLDTAFNWAKIGIEKGIATNPYLGTGFVAGFRTSGNSERPGFAWFFGRDALWTVLATTAYGDYASTRTALDFLEQFQRDDGKIPHEVSQSAALLDWFEDYPYPWASADATPLYVIVHADLWRATGNDTYLRDNWDSILKAYRFTEATDTDGDYLIENTNVGHGWIEGGELYGAHQEIYMQGIWIEAAESLAEMAAALGHEDIAAEARETAERTRRAVEDRYWLEEDGFYAFATGTPESRTAAWEENTVLQAVPLWWRTLDADRAERAIDHLGSGALATDWGTRILSAESADYDPLSYHNGSVWPLFTGWASMGAYAYGRSHVGYQALMANALLTYQDALGYVTELLSGDYNTAFGRSSHHQVWSEAMVATPAVSGLLGLDAREGGELLRFAPQLPAGWDAITLTNVRTGRGRFDIALERTAGETRIVIEQHENDSVQVEVAPAFPLDARIQSVSVNGQDMPFEVVEVGDIQQGVVRVASGPRVEVVYLHDPSTDVYVHQAIPEPGADNQGLRILRSRVESDTLHVLLEGRGGRTYDLHVRTPHEVGAVEGVTVTREDGQDALLRITFEGPPETYIRRSLQLPLE